MKLPPKLLLETEKDSKMAISDFPKLKNKAKGLVSANKFQIRKQNPTQLTAQFHRTKN